MKHNLLLSSITLISGLIYPLAFAPFEYRVLVFISIAGFIYSLYQVETKKYALLLGWLFGFGLFASGMYWVYHALNIYGEASALVAFFMTTLSATVFGIVFSFFSYIAFQFKKVTNTQQWFLFMPLLWAIFEYFRSWFLTGFPWLLAGSSQIDGLFSGYLPLVGVFGTSAIMVLFVTLIVLLLSPVFSCFSNYLKQQKDQPSNFQKTLKKNIYDKNQLLVIFIVFSIPITGLLTKNIQWTKAESSPIKVALIQGSIEQTLKFQAGMLEKSLNNYMTLSKQHLDADIIIWPETAIPTYFDQISYWFEPHIKAFKNSNTQLFTGIFTRDTHDKKRYYNSFLELTNKQQKYDKVHLVPFGEYMPLRSWFEFIAQYIQIPMSDIQAGKPEQKLIKVGENQASISICFEDAYSELFATAEQPDFYINISNDAWYGDSSAPWQHQEIARSRVAEYQKPLLRSTNNGISAIIGSNARIISQGEQFKETVVRAEIVPAKGLTPYATWQNKPLFLVTILSGVFLFIKNKGSRK